MACESQLRCESLHPFVKVWPVSDVDRHGVALIAEAARFAPNCSIVCSEWDLGNFACYGFSPRLPDLEA